MVTWSKLHRLATKAGMTLLALMLISANPAQAQLGRDSEWITPQGTLRIYDPNVGRRTPSTLYPSSNWKSGNGARVDLGDGMFIEMQGSYRNLVWSGEYWIMGGGGRHRPRRGCLPSRPPGYTAADDSYDHGTFTIRFNAAENSFTGTRQWKCKFANGASRAGPTETFNGTRANTFTVQGGPALSRDVPSLSGSAGGTEATPGSGTRLTLPDPNDCRRNQFAELLLKSPGAPDQLRPLSSRYAISRCSIDALAGEKFEILLKQPEGKRPMRLYLREFLLSDFGVATDPRRYRVTGQFGSDFLAQGLPFVGDPRPGYRIADRTLGGNFCNAPFWVAYLDFSDGTRSDPFAVLFSPCGARLHPEKLPQASGRLSPSERLGDLRVREE